MNKENKPVILETSDSLSDQDWKEFNLIDKWYSTQWEGYDPNIEEPYEMTEISQRKSPTENDENNAEQAAQILVNIRTYTETSRYSQIANEELWSKTLSDTSNSNNKIARYKQMKQHILSMILLY